MNVCDCKSRKRNITGGFLMSACLCSTQVAHPLGMLPGPLRLKAGEQCFASSLAAAGAARVRLLMGFLCRQRNTMLLHRYRIIP